jgi:hypothetical protein
MPYYIKKTVKPLEGYQLTETNRNELLEWCNGKKGLDGSIILKTPESGEGAQIVVTGDFIMKGYTEELGWHFWPVKPSYFNENYQEVGKPVTPQGV